MKRGKVLKTYLILDKVNLNPFMRTDAFHIFFIKRKTGQLNNFLQTRLE